MVRAWQNALKRAGGALSLGREKTFLVKFGNYFVYLVLVPGYVCSECMEDVERCTTSSGRIRLKTSSEVSSVASIWTLKSINIANFNIQAIWLDDG